MAALAGAGRVTRYASAGAIQALDRSSMVSGAEAGEIRPRSALSHPIGRSVADGARTCAHLYGIRCRTCLQSGGPAAVGGNKKRGLFGHAVSSPWCRNHDTAPGHLAGVFFCVRETNGGNDSHACQANGPPAPPGPSTPRAEDGPPGVLWFPRPQGGGAGSPKRGFVGKSLRTLDRGRALAGICDFVKAGGLPRPR